jgi:cell division protein ZapA
MNAPTEPVSITILDRKYQFACTPEQRKDLIAAAQSLDDRMKEIKESGRLMSLERIALQAALNLSDELLKIQRDNDLRTERIDNKIRLLADQLDNALKA